MVLTIGTAWITVLAALRVTLVLVVFLVAVAGSGVYTPDISA
jgi:hypothetical protein